MPDPHPFLLGLIGHPLGHTLSPRLHRAALAHAGLDGVYLPLPTTSEHVADAVKAMRAWRIRGLNVTIPHKEAVIPFLDGLTPRASRVGAVNTLFWEGDRLVGDNTDTAGFAALIEGIPVEDRQVLVLGAGGSARAVADVLGAQGAAEVCFVVRRAGAAGELVESFGKAFPKTRYRECAWEAVAEPLREASLLVNTTPVGMHPEGDRSPLSAEQVALLPAHAAVVDLIYRPATTRLLAEAHARGLTARNGLVMLMAQAAEAFERWTGERVPLPVWEGALDSASSEA
ncbi:shikimate dehydrogenase [bacterium]|nr:shikimate dehydrogenase [bacterium]